MIGRAVTVLLILLPLLLATRAGAQEQGCEAGPVSAPAERSWDRVALVIGNGAYRHADRLRNPANDARRMAAVLREAGVAVLLGIDLDRAGMERCLRAFGDRLEGGRVGLFFYAGHGMQVGGENHLLPVDARLQRERDLSFETVPLSQVLRTMEGAAPVNLVFLDACRDNPLARGLARSMGVRSGAVGRGLAGVQSGAGTLVSFATAPGSVAQDGVGDNSPFTTALAQHLTTRGLDVSTAMQRVRGAVMAATRQQQVPWDHSSLTGEVILAPAVAAAAVPEPAPAGVAPSIPPLPVAPVDRESLFWQSVMASSTRSDFEAYLQTYPNGTFAALARSRLAALATPPAPAAPTVPAAELARRAAEEARQAEVSRQAQEDAQRADMTRRASVQRAALLLGVQEGITTARWSGDCRDPSRIYEAAIRDGNLVWTSPGSTNIERIEAGDERSVRTVTISSRHETGRPEALGTAWTYTEIGNGIRVQPPLPRRGFTLVRCR